MKRKLFVCILMILLSPKSIWGQHLGLGQILEIYKNSQEHRETILRANSFELEGQVTPTCNSYVRTQPDVWSREFIEGMTTCKSGSLSYKSYSPDHSTNLKFQIVRTFKFEDKGVFSSSSGLLKNRYTKGDLEVQTYNTKDSNGEEFWVFQFIKNIDEQSSAIASSTKPKSTDFKRGAEVVTNSGTIGDSISKNYALLIAINDYENLRDLEHPINDLEKLKKVLVEQYTFEDKYIVTLQNPKKSDIDNALTDFIGKITEQDNLLLVFAGHGKEIAFSANSSSSKKLGFWSTANAQANGIGNWIQCSSVKDFVLGYNCKHVLVISDACFSGAFFGNTRRGSKEMSRSYKELYGYRSCHAMTSSAGTETNDQSVFMELLINRLERNQEAYLPASKLFYSFNEDVSNGGGATPLFGSISLDLGGEFFFFHK